MGNSFDAAFNGSGIQVTVMASTYPSAPNNPPGQQALTVNGPVIGNNPPQTTPLDVTGVHRRDYDHYGSFNWMIEIDGLSAGAFEKCDGLSFEVDLIEYAHGNDPYPRKRRGQVKWGNIKLTKGYTANSSLWDWCAEIMQGKMGRRTGAIHLLPDDAGSPVKSFRWINGFPVKWSGFKFDSSSGAHLVEEIEFAVEEVMVG